jgi:hypothetical protein
VLDGVQGLLGRLLPPPALPPLAKSSVVLAAPLIAADPHPAPNAKLLIKATLKE